MPGKLIVIEGLDGSGKATQTQNLAEYLAAEQISYRQVTFPDYDNPSSTLVKLYLSGQLGSADDVSAYAATSFYAADRYISYQTDWKKDYQSGKIILADRYSTSNAIYQMAKLPQGQWEEYLFWMADYEYSKLELPEPTAVIYLDVDPDISQRLLTKRYRGDASKRDIHERNVTYLKRCREAAQFAAKKLGWQVIPCSQNGQLDSIENVFSKLLSCIEKSVQP